METALELKPKDADLQVSLAETLLLTDRQTDSKKLVDEVLKQKPEHDGAKKLSERLK